MCVGIKYFSYLLLVLLFYYYIANIRIKNGINEISRNALVLSTIMELTVTLEFISPNKNIVWFVLATLIWVATLFLFVKNKDREVIIFNLEAGAYSIYLLGLRPYKNIDIKLFCFKNDKGEIICTNYIDESKGYNLLRIINIFTSLIMFIGSISIIFFLACEELNIIQFYDYEFIKPIEALVIAIGAVKLNRNSRDIIAIILRVVCIVYIAIMLFSVAVNGFMS